MSNDSGFHETGKKKTLQIELKYVRFNLFSYLMTLNVIGSFDVKKLNTHQTFHWIYFLQKMLFSFFVQTMDPIASYVSYV